MVTARRRGCEGAFCQVGLVLAGMPDHEKRDAEQEHMNVPLPSEDEAEMSSDDGSTVVANKKTKTGETSRIRPPLTNPAYNKQGARARKTPARRTHDPASQPAPSTSAGSSPASAEPAPQAPKKMQVKPLFVFVDQAHSYPVIKAALDAALLEKWSCISRGHDQLMVHTATVTEYHRAVKALEAAGVQHSVLLQRDEIPNKFVFCRVHSSMDKAFIQGEFQRMGLPVQNFWFLTNRQTRQPINKLVVELPKAINTDKVYAIKSFGGLNIRVEDYRHPKGPLQCGNCQRFGHSGKGCRASPVCRWCSQGHKTEVCPQGGDKKQMKCARCDGPHSANYRGCMAFKRENWRHLPQQERKERELQSKRAMRDNRRAAAAAPVPPPPQHAGPSGCQPQPPRQAWRAPSYPAPQQYNQYTALADSEFLKVVQQSKTFAQDPNLAQVLEPMCQLMAIWCNPAMSLQDKVQATMGFCGGVAVWQCGGVCSGVAVWLCGGVQVWQCGGVVVWQCGSVVVWQCGGVAVMKRARLEQTAWRDAAEVREARSDNRLACPLAPAAEEVFSEQRLSHVSRLSRAASQISLEITYHAASPHLGAEIQARIARGWTRCCATLICNTNTRIMKMSPRRAWSGVMLLAAMLCNADARAVCERCVCSNEILDCSNRTLEAHLSASDWTEAMRTSPAISTARFDFNQIVHVTPFPALPLTSLSLSHNSIVRVDKFAFQNLTNLTELDLSYNQLTSDQLTADVFKGTYAPSEYQPLQAMRVLKLGNNALHMLHSDLFVHLPELEVLLLEKNEFYVLDHVTVMALSSLPNLKVLDLSYNDMRTFPDTLLHSTRLLARLSLEGNQLTRVPQGLANSHRLEHLSLSDNPIQAIDADTGFPWLPYLKSLQLSYMGQLERIGAGGLSRLTGLEELHCNHNPRLRVVDEAALSRSEDGNSQATWPPLRKLWLNDNVLGYLSSRLVDRWDKLDVIDIQMNPWICDCENQWVVSTLVKVVESKNPDLVEGIMCGAPEEMKGRRAADLEARRYNMRCLDVDGAHPERDGVLLIGVLVGALVAAPATLAAVFLWRKAQQLLQGRRAQAYSRAYYTRATSHDDIAP
ncbi:uncharacterized protein LOC134528998 [Bacillus rossius redtenbacheri]|uniref:uncharacterized protein LOC134528998 n=1 Tax=Bacillus rossius redtenbacheri TaxID=93214 RepID=UPI002FDE7183